MKKLLNKPEVILKKKIITHFHIKLFNCDVIYERPLECFFDNLKEKVLDVFLISQPRVVQRGSPELVLPRRLHAAFDQERDDLQINGIELTITIGITKP